MIVPDKGAARSAKAKNSNSLGMESFSIRR